MSDSDGPTDIDFQANTYNQMKKFDRMHDGDYSSDEDAK